MGLGIVASLGYARGFPVLGHALVFETRLLEQSSLITTSYSQAKFGLMS